MAILIDLFIVFACISIDQYSKYLITSYLDLYESKTLIDGFFNLTYVQNYGAGFSIMQNAKTTFYIITPICLAIFIYMLIKSKDKLTRFALLLMIGGTLGNFIDRLKTVYVIDFLDFNIFGWDFPVFNMADSFLTIGVFILIITVILEEKNAKSKANS